MMEIHLTRRRPSGPPGIDRGQMGLVPADAHHKYLPGSDGEYITSYRVPPIPADEIDHRALTWP